MLPTQEEQVLDEASITLRVELRADTLLGPGKAALLQGIRETGSIAAAGRRMGMSYKRAWYLIDTLNGAFHEPLVTASKGGKTGGGAQLTPTGAAILDGYRRMEAAASEAVAGELAHLSTLLKPMT
ncbi:winged helix-turn-helix domain-containing protein [Methylobacterium longum]|uniref:Winged helix-turn-helix domain-containing protein n=1 Tax=Methylobacterium longum TaxID=767694 RepID=A0ABT8ANG2_9HYPH|nr:winged helix-turn-helix domain-containing protein [Methylobacterium longum]MDN3571434.1 winged helix-turn-helix domain-containing protein [Methylobacterium longum]